MNQGWETLHNPHGCGEGDSSMARDGDILFSVITPSTGNRPKALEKAVHSVEQAARFAGLETGQLEILIGFDGVKGKPPASAYPVRSINLPPDRNGGNGIRSLLTNIAQGEKLIYLDDDNTLKPYTFRLYLKHFDAEIGRASCRERVLRLV